MAKGTFATVDHFLDRLVPLLEVLPKGPRYAVEIHNPEYLGPAYFTALSSLNVAHVFNAWPQMPDLGRQIDMEGAWTADFAVVRAMLSHEITHKHSFNMFRP